MSNSMAAQAEDLPLAICPRCALGYSPYFRSFSAWQLLPLPTPTKMGYRSVLDRQTLSCSEDPVRS